MARFRLGWWLVLQPIFWWWFATLAHAQVVINEVYPNPNTGEEEWVELYNSGQETVELAGWELWDQLSTLSKAYSFGTEVELASQEFLVISLTNKLNNGGDTVILQDASGGEIDLFEYTSSSKGKSWARNPLDFAEIFETEPTKGETNPEPEPKPTPTPIPSPTSTLPPPTTATAIPSSQTTATSHEPSPTVLGAVASEFTYPLTVLKPKLTYDKKTSWTQDHIAFLSPPALEKGALSVIMGGLLLLIPGLFYVKNRQQSF
jgi:hypothetical protein